ncbi:MAG: hypothetical protein DRN68_06305, partial [Thaumarchaeota archaeon]
MSKKILVILPIIVALLLGLVAYTSPVQSQPYYELTFTLKDQLGYPLKNVDVAIVIVNKTCPCALAVGFGTTDSNGKVTIPTVPGLPPVASVRFDWNITILIKSVDRWGDQWFLFHHSEGTFLPGDNWVNEFNGAVVYGEYFVNLRFIAHTDIDEKDNDNPINDTVILEDFSSTNNLALNDNFATMPQANPIWTPFTGNYLPKGWTNVVWPTNYIPGLPAPVGPSYCHMDTQGNNYITGWQTKQVFYPWFSDVILVQGIFQPRAAYGEWQSALMLYENDNNMTVIVADGTTGTFHFVTVKDGIVTDINTGVAYTLGNDYAFVFTVTGDNTYGFIFDVTAGWTLKTHTSFDTVMRPFRVAFVQGASSNNTVQHTYIDYIGATVLSNWEWYKGGLKGTYANIVATTGRWPSTSALTWQRPTPNPSPWPTMWIWPCPIHKWMLNMQTNPGTSTISGIQTRYILNFFPAVVKANVTPFGGSDWVIGLQLYKDNGNSLTVFADGATGQFAIAEMKAGAYTKYSSGITWMSGSPYIFEYVIAGGTTTVNVRNGVTGSLIWSRTFNYILKPVKIALVQTGTNVDADVDWLRVQVSDRTDPIEPGKDDWFDEVPNFIDNNGNPMGKVVSEVWVDPAGAGFTKVWESGIDNEGYTGYFNISTVKADFNYRPTIDPMILITNVWNTTLEKYDYWIPANTSIKILAGKEIITFNITNVKPNKMPDGRDWLFLTSEQVAMPPALPQDPHAIFTLYSINVTHVFTDSGHPNRGPRTELMDMQLYTPCPTPGHIPWNNRALAPSGTAVWVEDFLYFEFPYVKLYDHEWHPVWSGATQVKAFFEIDNCIVGEGQAKYEYEEEYEEYLQYEYLPRITYCCDYSISHFPEAGWMGSLNITCDGLVFKPDHHNAPFFVLPFTELTLHKNYTLEVTWENVLIFSRPVSVNFTRTWAVDPHPTPFWFFTSPYSRNGRINIRTSIMKVHIQVKDLEPVPQPVGSSVSTTHLRAWLRGPMQIWTSVDELGNVLLPPYKWVLSSGYPTADYPLYYPYGYLPIPWNVSQDNTDVCWDSFYYLKFEWAGSPEAMKDGEYVDVTIYDPPDYRKLNTVSCPCYPPWYSYGVSGAWHYGNSTLEVQFCCDVDIVVYVKLYQVKFQALSLCNDPLYPNADQEITETKVVLEGPDPTYYELSDPHDPDAKLYIWWYDPETGHEKLIAETTLQEPNGTTP